MAIGINGILANYRTKIAALSGFVEVKDSLEIEDAPYTTANKQFSLLLRSMDHKDRGKLEGAFGGSHLDLVAVVRLDVRYLTQVDEEALHLTIGSDWENVTQVLLKAGNRYSDASTTQLTPLQPQSQTVVSKVDKVMWKVVGDFTVTYRLVLALN